MSRLDKPALCEALCKARYFRGPNFSRQSARRGRAPLIKCRGDGRFPHIFRAKVNAFREVGNGDRRLVDPMRPRPGTGYQPRRTGILK